MSSGLVIAGRLRRTEDVDVETGTKDRPRIGARMYTVRNPCPAAPAARSPQPAKKANSRGPNPAPG